MNAKTAKLIRRFARVSGENYRTLKSRWNSESAPRRAEVRVQMEAQVWSTRCHEWRERMGVIAKEAADRLDVPFDTYRGWEKGATPARFVRNEISKRMGELLEEKL